VIDDVNNHISRVYNDGYFTGGGAGYPDYLGEGQLLRAHGQRYARLLKRYLSPGKVLDIGAAAGFVLLGLQDDGWEARGVEPNRSMAAFAREHLGIPVTTGRFEDFRTDETFDLVCMIQVLPHLVDPTSAMRQAAQLTKPGGHLLIETWNRRSWIARCFGKHWHEYSPPSVLHWFTPESVRCLAKKAGYHEVKKGRPKKRLSGVHFKSLVSHKLGGSIPGRVVRRILAFVPNRLTLPYPAEDLFWALFRLGAERHPSNRMASEMASIHPRW
jgi:SAM-dependent methyltransferase